MFSRLLKTAGRPPHRLRLAARVPRDFDAGRAALHAALRRLGDAGVFSRAPPAAQPRADLGPGGTRRPRSRQRQNRRALDQRAGITRCARCHKHQSGAPPSTSWRRRSGRNGGSPRPNRRESMWRTPPVAAPPARHLVRRTAASPNPKPRGLITSATPSEPVGDVVGLPRAAAGVAAAGRLRVRGARRPQLWSLTPIGVQHRRVAVPTRKTSRARVGTSIFSPPTLKWRRSPPVNCGRRTTTPATCGTFVGRRPASTQNRRALWWRRLEPPPPAAPRPLADVLSDIGFASRRAASRRARCRVGR